jgi:hypothetical protein
MRGPTGRRTPGGRPAVVRTQPVREALKPATSASSCSRNTRPTQKPAGCGMSHAMPLELPPAATT